MAGEIGISLGLRQLDGAGGGGAPYHADAVHFDADTTRISRVDPLTGLAASSVGAVCFWRHSPTVSGLSFFNNSGDGFFEFNTGTSLTAYFEGEDGSFSDVGWDAAFGDGDWKCLMLAWDLNALPTARIFQAYLDDVSLGAPTLDEDGIAFQLPWATMGNLRLNSDDGLTDAANFVAYFSTFIDWSVEANRRLFLTADLKPTNPSGFPANPNILFLGDAAAFPVNQGTGGAFEISVGSLTNASTSPSD